MDRIHCSGLPLFPHSALARLVSRAGLARADPTSWFRCVSSVQRCQFTGRGHAGVGFYLARVLPDWCFGMRIPSGQWTLDLRDHLGIVDFTHGSGSCFQAVYGHRLWFEILGVSLAGGRLFLRGRRQRLRWSRRKTGCTKRRSNPGWSRQKSVVTTRLVNQPKLLQTIDSVQWF